MTPSRRKTLVYFALSVALVSVAVFWVGAKIRLAQVAASNQKTAFEAVLGGHRLVQAPGLPSSITIADGKILSRGGVDNFETVEVAGIEPASPWMVSQGLSQSTPTAYLWYQKVLRATI